MSERDQPTSLKAGPDRSESPAPGPGGGGASGCCQWLWMLRSLLRHSGVLLLCQSQAVAPRPLAALRQRRVTGRRDCSLNSRQPAATAVLAEAAQVRATGLVGPAGPGLARADFASGWTCPALASSDFGALSAGSELQRSSCQSDSDWRPWLRPAT